MNIKQLTNVKSIYSPVKLISVFVTFVTLIGCSSPLKYEPRAQKPIASEKTNTSGFVKKSDCKTAYQIQSGDTLSGIAQKCAVSQTLLAQLNGIDRPDKIYIGQWLKVPSNKVGQPYSKSASQVDQIRRESREESSSRKVELASDSTWQWPTKTNLPYRWSKDANGISMLDIDGNIGDSVFAVAEGVVVYADDGIREFGKMVMIRHASGKLSVYAHASELLVTQNEKVTQGQEIAKMGATGMTVKPKLHLEVRFLGKKVQLKPLLSN